MTTLTHAQLAAVPVLELLTGRGPFVTAYLPTPSEVEDARQRLETAVKTAVNEFESSGAPAAAVDRFRREVEDAAHDRGSTLVVVANAEAAWSWGLPDPFPQLVAEVSELPRVGPLLERSQAEVPYAVVLLDHEGADLVSVVGGAASASLKVSGDTEHIHRGQPGGWSQRRFQQRAENTWEDNARAVAATTIEVFEHTDPRVVFVTGDEHAVHFLLEHLPDRIADRTRKLDHGGRPTTDVGELAAELRTSAQQVVADDTAAALERFASLRSDDLAVEGVEATLAALFSARADELLLHVDPADPRTAFFGPEPGQVAADRDTLDALDIPARQGPLVEVALRAAAGTGADLWFVPETGAAAPTDGMGAVLRG